MHILKGTYPLKTRRLCLTVLQHIQFGESPSCLYLNGANGLGKTSFIEKVMIPALKAQRVPFLYLGQDFRTQLYTLKAVLAISGKVGVPDNIPEILTQWVNRNQHARIFILDEFDKYPAYIDHLFKISRHFIGTYVIVSHAANPVQPGGPFELRTLQFHRAQDVGPLLQVEIGER